MRKIVLLLFLFTSFVAKAQLGFEQYYSERELLGILQKAKSNWDQLDANGFLAVHYKASNKDSLARIFINKIRAVSADSKDVKLKARSLWWNNYYDGDTSTARAYLDWASRNNLIKEEISGYVELTSIQIHINLEEAEKNVLMAKKLWDGWKADSTTKDSLKLEVLRQMAHVYVHKKDGVKAVSYLLPIQDYAKQDRNLALKELALNCISGMYSEWSGQYKKATEWMVKLYELYKKLKLPNKTLYAVSRLASQYINVGDTVKAKQYSIEVERLMDSIGAYGNNVEWYYGSKYYGGLITKDEYARLIENDFNNKYFLPPAKKAFLKLNLYGQLGIMDSVRIYLSAYEKLSGDSVLAKDANFSFFRMMYLIESKQYGMLIPLLKEMRTRAEKKGDLSEILEICKYQAEAYAGIRDYKNAYEFLNLAYKFKDSLEKLSGKDDVSLMELQKYEELQSAAYDEEKKVIAAEQARIRFNNRVRIYGLGAGLVILLSIAALLWRNSRQKQKANRVLEKTLDDLKNTQAQLVQSEKMASLGELTAGIAHEIQNPLNFVNNFSEVNAELIDELEEQLTKGNMHPDSYRVAKEISQSLKDNEQKILHHGKRADAIVKSMLQHSRISTGKKELTDINGLAEEYLRLAYHGLRAKDKSFNAKFETDLDPTIGKISIVPEEVGRVLLNLINNAFQAVSDRKRNEPGIEPEVIIQTRKSNGWATIMVRDNGNGISPAVLDKIFQPFFTTKPAGQGTGLGLSLSYDIVKAHGGELLVKTNEGQGSEFIIQLPVN